MIYLLTLLIVRDNLQEQQNKKIIITSNFYQSQHQYQQESIF